MVVPLCCVSTRSERNPNKLTVYPPIQHRSRLQSLESSETSLQDRSPTPKAKFVPPRKWSPTRLRALSRQRRPKNLPLTADWATEGSNRIDKSSTQVDAVPIEALTARWTTIRTISQKLVSGQEVVVEMSVGCEQPQHDVDGLASTSETTSSRPYRVTVRSKSGEIIFERT